MIKRDLKKFYKIKENKKILIVGGSGFIGRHLTKKCINKNFKVFSLSLNSVKKCHRLKKVNYLVCDITNKAKLLVSHNLLISFLISLI